MTPAPGIVPMSGLSSLLVIRKIRDDAETSRARMFVTLLEGSPHQGRLCSGRTVLSGEQMIFEGTRGVTAARVTLSAGDLQDGVVCDEDARG